MWDYWNPVRIAGDLSHLLAKCILIFSIHRNKSAEGVSIITQCLYATVFCTRYLDLPWEPSKWNFCFKIIYISTSFYTIAIMQWVYPRSREREISWKMGAAVLGGSLLLSPFVMLIFERASFITWLWVFSQILESVCVLPQLFLLRQTTVPTVINSFYLLALGSYRALYLVNWFVREFEMHGAKPDAVSVIFGIIQTALYVDFAWVYYTRQRVKLRNGGIVDADDIRRGWIIGRIFGTAIDAAGPDDDDEESAPALGSANGEPSSRHRPTRAKWGSRGISVSADDGVLDPVDPDAKLRDPEELARALDDDDNDNDDNDNTLPPPTPSQSHMDQPSGIKNGQEWRDE